MTNPKELNRPRLLTAPSVAKLKPAAVRLEIPDLGCPGLRLVVQPSGYKSWAMRFRNNGGHAKLTLGEVDLSGKEAATDPKIGYPLTLAAAHALAADIKRQRERDIDVVAEHKTNKQRRRDSILQRGANTFGPAARDFIDKYKVKKSGLKPRRWRETARLLGLDYPADGKPPTVIRHGLTERWAEKPIADITEDHIYHLVKEAKNDGTPGIERRNDGTSDPRGRRMADALGGLFKWLKANRKITVNPCIGLERPGAPAKRERFLNCKTDVRNADELRWFWAATDKVGEPFGSVLKLLLLTGCRLNEIARAEHSELSDDYSMLRLSGSRTKNGLPHNVPLPPLAQEMLGRIIKHPCGKFVFTTNGKTPVSGFSKIKKRLDSAMAEEANGKVEPWRLHDLRRTASTGMAGIGILPHIIEACLNHVSGAKASVAGTYNQEMYEPEKRAALRDWANHVTGIVNRTKSNVTPMRRA
jgi:integrase